MRESLKLLKERQLIAQKNGEGTFIAKPESECYRFSTACCGWMISDIWMYMRCASCWSPMPAGVVAEKKDDLDFEKLEQYLQGMIERGCMG